VNNDAMPAAKLEPRTNLGSEWHFFKVPQHVAIDAQLVFGLGLKLRDERASASRRLVPLRCQPCEVGARRALCYPDHRKQENKHAGGDET
jgi:hypothetical protein